MNSFGPNLNQFEYWLDSHQFTDWIKLEKGSSKLCLVTLIGSIQFQGSMAVATSFDG